MAALLPVPAFTRFLLAPRQEWGLTRLLLLPLLAWKQLRRPTSGTDTPPVEPGQGDVLVLLDSSWHLPIWPAAAAAQAAEEKPQSLLSSKPSKP